MQSDPARPNRAITADAAATSPNCVSSSSWLVYRAGDPPTLSLAGQSPGAVTRTSLYRKLIAGQSG